jgi:hypothetical protein
MVRQPPAAKVRTIQATTTIPAAKAGENAKSRRHAERQPPPFVDAIRIDCCVQCTKALAGRLLFPLREETSRPDPEFERKNERTEVSNPLDHHLPRFHTDVCAV